MIAPRRYLPSISALLAFEAVARLGSATRAAHELSLTQSAVSRQLKTLEEQLGAQLLTRQGRHLHLTPAGQGYVGPVRDILNSLAQASVGVRARPQAGALNLAILPAFGMHWLAPRLRDFSLVAPEVTVNLSTRLRPFDIAQTAFDAAIHFGHTDWPGVRYLPLMAETVIPVCAPDLIPAQIDTPDDMLRFPLLHLETRPRGWARWLAAQGIEAEPPDGMVFDQFSTMAQAAVHGLGIALLPAFFAEPYLQDGKLTRASPHTADSIGHYYLVWPEDRMESPALKAFRDWLMGQLPAKSAPQTA